jgi:hypothetical protein
MKSSRLLTLIVIFAALVLLAGLPCCGEKAPSDKAESNGHEDHSQAAKEADGHEGHQHAMKEGDSHEGHDHDMENVPKRRPKKIPQSVMDTLRAKKVRYNITKDLYWDDKGGVLANDFMEVHYPPGPTTVTHGMHAFEQIVFAREKCRSYWGVVPDEKLNVSSPLEMEQYKLQTGRDWWHYSKIEGNQITFQPIYILHQRGLGEIAFAHEYHKWAIGKLSKGEAPRLLMEGIASHLSEEKAILLQQVQHLSEEEQKMTAKEVENTLKKESKMEPTRLAYYHAHRLVTGIIHRHGDEALQLIMKRLREGVKLDSAFQEACHKSYQEVLKEVADYKGDV